MSNESDIFISYSHNDADWAEWIAWQLESGGYRVTIQAWDFRPGHNFVLRMQEAAASTNQTLIVLSPNFLTSAFTAPEWAAAFSRDPTGRNSTILPVRVRECHPEGLLGQIVYIDLVGLDESAARERLLAELTQERSKPTAPPLFPLPELMATTAPERSPFPGPQDAEREPDELELAIRWYVSSESSEVDLLDLTGIKRPVQHHIEERWRRSESEPLQVLLGVTHNHHHLYLDLVRDGPCGFIVGYSGTGTSELSRTVAMSAAITYPPSRIHLHLVDFKGGGVWRELRPLPHVVSIISALAHNDARQQVSDALNDLIAQKMHKLKVAGASDIAEHNALVPAEDRLPYDVILVDEIGGGIELQNALVNVQQRGRSLGVGLIISAQSYQWLSRDFQALSRFAIAMGGVRDNDPGLLPDFVASRLWSLEKSFTRFEAPFTRTPVGRALLVKSGYEVLPFQTAYTGNWLRESRDSPYLGNPILREIIAATKAAAL